MTNDANGADTSVDSADASNVADASIPDPGTTWTKTGIAFVSDRPDDDKRILCPWVIRLADGRFRALYMGFGSTAPDGTFGRLLSAISNDGVTWTKEPGIRLDHHPGAEYRVLSESIIAKPGGGFRMYYEAVGNLGNVVMSATSSDGLVWTPDEGLRLSELQTILGSPRALVLPNGSVRLYFHRYPSPVEIRLDAGNHVLSATSTDGLAFTVDQGVRIPQTIEAYEKEATYCAQPIDLGGGKVRVIYSGWNGETTGRGVIMTALSTDGGVTFTKVPKPILLSDSALDKTFASEPCVYRDAKGQWRMLYEASGEDGVLRILGAVAG